MTKKKKNPVRNMRQNFPMLLKFTNVKRFIATRGKKILDEKVAILYFFNVRATRKWRESVFTIQSLAWNHLPVRSNYLQSPGTSMCTIIPALHPWLRLCIIMSTQLHRFESLTYFQFAMDTKAMGKKMKWREEDRGRNEGGKKDR